LRDKVSVNGKGFSDLVREGQRVIDSAAMQPLLTVNLDECALYVGETPIELPPTQLVVYAAFLRQKLEHCQFPTRNACLDCTACFRPVNYFLTLEILERMEVDYSKIKCKSRKLDNLLERWKSVNFDEPQFRTLLSKIKTAIKDELKDDALSTFYIICSSQGVWKRGGTQGVKVDKGRIVIS
jgi:hypothetical protein